jgi:hypothetical protein
VEESVNRKTVPSYKDVFETNGNLSLALANHVNWLRHYATSRMVTSSIAVEVTAVFN